MKLGEWMTARERENEGKTKVWELWANAGPSFLGYVLWSTGWRRYVLQAYDTARFDPACLRTIAEFLEARTAEQKATWKKYTPRELELLAERARFRADLGRPA